MLENEKFLPLINHRRDIYYHNHLDKLKEDEDYYYKFNLFIDRLVRNRVLDLNNKKKYRNFCKKFYLKMEHKKKMYGK